MEEIIFYKFSNDEECRTIECLLKLRGDSFYSFYVVVNLYCIKNHINDNELRSIFINNLSFGKSRISNLYMDTLKDLISNLKNHYIIISEEALNLIKDKLKTLNVSFKVASLNITLNEL